MWALGCVHFPYLCFSGSGSQVLHKGIGSVGSDFCAQVLCPSQVWAAQVTRCLASTRSPGVVHLSTSPVPAAQFPGCAAASQVCHVSLLGSWSLATTDVNRPGSQEDLVSDWEPACCLVGYDVSGAECGPFLLALAGARLPPCLWQGIGRSTAS